MSLGKVLHASKKTGGSDEWGTPQRIFDKLNEEFSFSLDACASEWNAKCPRYYTEDDDGLMLPWETWTWCNPPYSNIVDWYAKAAREATLGNSSVILTFARTDTKAFHEYAARASAMVFLRGRIKFIDPATREPGNAAPAPSVLVFFDANKLGLRCKVDFAKI